MNTMIEKFAPLGIFFSFESWDYILLPPNLYDYQDVPDEYNAIFSLNTHADGLDIYFFGDGIYDNGRANPMYETNPACLIGDGISSAGVPFSETAVLAHEAGHCLGLLHTDEFQCDESSCDTNPSFCSCEDYVYDTASGDVGNIMAVGCLDCPKIFSEGQKRRMKRYLTECQNLQPIVTTGPVRIIQNLNINYNVSTAYCWPDIIIEPKSSLTITTAVAMQEGAKILVEAGGKLTVNAGSITGCNGGYWTGIEVKGDMTEPQSFPMDAQGFVVLKNGAILQNAETSFRVDGGGAVWAFSSDIVNCGGAMFLPYSLHNTSRFQYCNFLHDGFDPTNPTTFHAMLLGVRDVNFTGCTFTNVNTPSSYSTAAISSLSSGFYVNNSSFDGFVNAVGAYGWFFGPPTRFTVYNSSFANNKTGIFCLGVNNFTILANQFEIGGAPFNTPGEHAVGIMMDNCTGYKIEKNTFTGVASSAMRFGTLTQNSGSEANNIDGNYFDYLDVANQAQGNNRGDFSGLQYWCNVNRGNNLRDFFVAGSGNGIWISQGNGLATRDTFSHHGVLFDSDFRNEVGFIDFYHRNIAFEILQYHSGINPFQVNNFNDCPQDGYYDENDKLTTNEKAVARQAYMDAKTGYQSEKADWLGLIDGGDTNGLLDDIANATINDETTLSSSLLSISPYLSSAVLEAVIGRDDIFTDESISSILTANPDELRNSALRDLISSEFSKGMRDTILSFTGTTTSRTTQENLIAGYRTDMHRNANLLIRDLLGDTLGYETDTLLMWLQNKGSLEASYEMASAYLTIGDMTEAYQLFDDIPQLYELTEEQQIEHDLYRALAEFHVALQQGGTLLWELDSMQLAYLTGLVESSTGPAGASAKGVLNVLYGGNYLVFPEMPGGVSEFLVMPQAEGFISVANTQSIKAYPNPARNNVTFSWHLPEEQEEAVIIVADLNGREVEKIKVSGRKGNIGWRTDNTEAGVYFYKIGSQSGYSEIAKLVLIK